jgi:hypothetical protein
VDLHKKHVLVRLAFIQEKAMNLHKVVKEGVEEEEAAKMKTFGSSTGCFH